MSDPIRHPVDRAVAAVRAVYRTRVVWVSALGALAAGLSALGFAGLLAGSGAWVRPTVLPLALWAATLAVWAGLAGWGVRRWRGFDLRAAAGTAEAVRGDAPGEVRVAVELARVRAGESASLAERHRFRIGVALGLLSASVLAAPALARLRKPRRAAAWALAGAVLLTLVPAMGGEGAFGRAAEGLRRPFAYLAPVPRPPLALSVATRAPRRGADVPVSIEAAGRDSVALRWQPRAEVARTTWLAVADGRAKGAVAGVDAPTAVWAQAPDGARSEPVEIVPVDPLLLADLTVELRYPGYTGRSAEILSPPFAAATVPAGTQVRVEGRANRGLGAAALEGVAGAPDLGFAVQGDRFAGAFRARSGRWAWRIAAADGETLEFPPDTLALDVVADSAPVVAIAYPGADTTISPEMIQPLVIDVRDDYGVSRVELVSWRVSAWGERHPPLVDPLEPGAGATLRLVLEPMLDARGRGFFPGDTLRYFARAWDNAPSPQEGRSREYALRLPTLAELRDRSRVELDDAMEAARALAESAREQAREAQALERSTRESGTERRGERGGRGGGDVDFQATEAARKALEEGERLAERVDEVRRALEEVERVLERAGLSDPELGRRLDELQSLYEKVLTPELRARLDDLRRSLQSLDPEALREAVKRLAETASDLREQIDRSLKLLERVRVEQEFAALAAEARELSRTQEALAERAETSPESLPRPAEAVSEAADSLVRRAEEFARALEQGGEAESARRVDGARERLESSAAAAEAGARSAQADPRRAGDSFRRGAQAAREAAEQLDRARAEMAAGWRERVMEALRRAQAEALQLGERQQELGENLRSTGDRESARMQGAAIQRGLQAMGQSLSQASEGTLLLDPTVAAALGRAASTMSQLLESLGQPGASPEASAGRSRAALEGLNDLALSLMENRRAIAQGGSGTGFEEALERLARLAREQGTLNDAVGGLSPLGLPLQVLGQRLQQLAAEQAAIGEALRELGREMGGRGEVLGRVDRLGEEAERIARELERGRLTPELMRRQQELFHRLLDAGRTLEREDVERERRAERPRGARAEAVAPLPAGLLRGPRYPRPAESELRQYPPTYRRLILDYFDALNQAGGTGGTPRP